MSEGPKKAIHLDHSIFAHSTSGGVRRWWIEHVRSISDHNEFKITSYLPRESQAPILLPGAMVEIGRFRSTTWPLQRISIRGNGVFHSSLSRVADCAGKCGIHNVVTFHDATQLRERGIRGFAQEYFRSKVLMRADVIHCISYHSRNELIEYLPSVESKSVVIYHGFNPLPAPSAQTGDKVQSNPFYLFVGPRAGYKNGLLAMKLISLIKEKDHRLLFVGGGSPSKSELQEIIRLNIADRVVFAGTISDAGLSWCYSNAVALLYISSNEGFGFPVLEAAQFNCPVVAIDGHSVSEIGVGYVSLSESLEPDAILSAIEKANSMRGRLNGQSVVGRFSWDTYSRRMCEIYSSL